MELVDSAKQVFAGGNNVIYKSTKDGKSYAIKRYSQQDSERLNREYCALQFLSEQGIRTVPSVHGCDKERQLGIYDWIDGKHVSDVTVEHIDQLIHFLSELKRLSKESGAKSLPLAKDACIKATDLTKLIDARFERLKNIEDEEAEVMRFVFQDCIKAYESLKPKSQGLVADNLTLSPSDYGFHNALEAADGKLTFIDFEYFGWDDPVKMIADFLWHPGQQLSDKIKQYFKSEIFKTFPDISARFYALFPLYGLVWVLILLNNFIPSVWQTKLETGVVSDDDKEILLKRQYKKAQFLLKQVLIYGN